MDDLPARLFLLTELDELALSLEAGLLFEDSD
jgi:hypothetical protein